MHAGHRAFGPLGSARSSAEEDPAVIDLEPERQTVYAQVTAHFTMTAPDLG